MTALEVDRRMGGWVGVTYDNISVGHTAEQQPLSITEDDLVRYYQCLDEKRPAPSPGTRIPSFILNEMRTFKNQLRFPPGVLHAQEEIEMQSAARLGEPLQVKLVVADKYLRNGKRFVVAEQHVSCATDQRPVMKIRHILYWPC